MALSNILQQIANAGSSFGGVPDWLSQAQPQYPEQPMVGAGVDGPMQSNVLQQVSAPHQPQQSGEAPRPRRSLLDTIGRISDVVARVGGADALYQPTLDARDDRARMIEDHARQVEMQGLQKQQAELGIEANRMGIDDSVRGRMAQALGAAASSGNAAEIWPVVAKQAGIPDQMIAAVGAELQRNPKVAETLAAGLGFKRPQEPSSAKELQIYSLLETKDPSLAKLYLQNLSNPDSMTDYQRGQLTLGLKRFQLSRDRQSAKDQAGDTSSQLVPVATSLISELESAVNRLAGAGSMNAPGQSMGGRIGAVAMENVPFLERVTNPEGYTARQDLERLRTQGVASLVPLFSSIKLGGKNIDSAAEAKKWEGAIASITDQNSAIRAINWMKQRINQLTAASAAPQQSAPGRKVIPRGRSKGASQSSGGWGKATVVGN